MNRRTVLATVGSTGIAGIAGCTGILGGGGCSTPSGDDLKGMLPEGGDTFSMEGDAQSISGDSKGVQMEAQKAAFARYTDGDGNKYTYTIQKFENQSAAEDWVNNQTSSDSSDVRGTAGYVVTGGYIFVVGGEKASKSKIKSLLKQSSAISGGCVNSNAEFVGKNA